MIDLVVAHYNEDIQWLKTLDGNVIVYSKGLNGDLPNMGRESHTYLHHIVENYDAICARPMATTVFLQGCIADHIQNKKESDFVAKLVSEAQQNGKSQNAQVWNVGYYNARWDLKIPEQPNVKPCTLAFGPWFVLYVSQIFPFEDLKWYMGGLFAMRNDVITNRPKHYYQNLLVQLSDSENPAVGHYFERAWYYIFKHSNHIL